MNFVVIVMKYYFYFLNVTKLIIILNNKNMRFEYIHLEKNRNSAVHNTEYENVHPVSVVYPCTP